MCPAPHTDKQRTGFTVVDRDAGVAIGAFSADRFADSLTFASDERKRLNGHVTIGIDSIYRCGCKFAR